MDVAVGMIAQLEEAPNPIKKRYTRRSSALSNRAVLLKEDDKHDGALRVPVDFPALLGQ